jgi:two-component system cell cycle sensor histidine kinase/response regulator CckA
MSSIIPKILYLEDNLDDVILVKSLLKKKGIKCHITHVLGREDFITAMTQENFDLILADYLVPSFNGIRALQFVRKKLLLETPFIIISGSVGEEVAIETLKNGATDYVLKERIAKLVPSITRALQESRERIKSRQIEQALEQSQEKYHTLFVTMKEGVALHEIIYNQMKQPEDYRFLDINPAYQSILEIEKDKIIGRRASEVFNTDSPPYLDIYAKVVKSKKSVTFETYDPRLKKYFNLSVYSPAKGQFATFISDITEQKKLAIKIEESELILDSIIKNVPDIIYRLDKNGIITFISNAVNNYGYDPERLIGTKMIDLVHPEDKEKAINKINEKRTGKRRTKTLEIRLLAKNKDIVPFETKVTDIKYNPVFLISAEGLYSSEKPRKESFKGTQGVARDITERKRTEEILKRNERQLAESQKIARLGNWNLNLLDKKFYCSNELFKIFGIPPEMDNINYKKFLRLFHPDDRKFIQKSIHDIVYNKRLFNHIHHIIRPDSEERTVHQQIKVIYNIKNKPVEIIGTIQDITEQKKLEQELRQAQKMEALGRFAGGIAHDFNNLLTVIKGNSELIRMHLEKKDPMSKSMEQIELATTKAESLIKQLLTFSREQVLQPKIVNINTIIKNMEKMLKRIIHEDIELVTSLSEETGSIEADQGKIEQVIMNLVVNASDAMPDGGTLVIETQKIDLKTTILWEDLQIKPGCYVMLGISDSGTGIDKKIQNKIFDPFFTTKATDKGTGLGLSTVYGIVKQSGGTIRFYSESGKGTKFKIYFPQKEQGAVMEIEQNAEKSIRGKETILIVEDEESVRKITGRTLKTFGYNVIESSGSNEAIQLYKKYKNKIDILLTDVVMPKMNGRELVKELLKLKPDLKVAYMSGYADDAIAKYKISEENFPFIKKPFSASELTQKIREALNNH